ncbi:secretin N-terminal domain-containing protein [Sulfurimonas sp. NW15]|uniref:type II secretion system protein GspD n=1 Tax=Sulfurimonas sp. NW15 TaxID=2922729 RepID=UPI003DA7DAC1
MKILLLLFLAHTLFGSTVCENQLFSLSAYKQKQKSAIEVASILKELSATCKLSIVFNDDVSKKMLHKKLDYVNINNYTFEQFLDFLFNEANLFYTYEPTKNTLEVQYLKTKTFNVDYIYLSELSSESSKSITTGAAGISAGISGGGAGGLSGGGGGFGGGGAGGNNRGQNSGNSSSNDSTTISSKSRFTYWDNLQSNVLKLFHKKENVRIFINKDASLLTVTSTKKNLEKVDRYLNVLLKKMHKQVAIEAKIIELTYDDSSSTGIDWSKLDLSLSGSITNDPGAEGATLLNRPTYNLAYSFSTAKFLKYLKTYGDIKVLSNPKVVTMNNQPAVINVGDQLSYKFQSGSVTTTGGTAAATNLFSVGSTFIGVTLYVIPEVSQNNEIIMKINPVVSKLADNTSTTNTASSATRELPPDTKIKQMTSIVRIKNNEKIVIGGLVSITKGGSSVKVPLLGDIPFFGSLFNYKEKIKQKTEMFIIIQPHVVTTKAMPTLRDIDLKDPFFQSTFDKNSTIENTTNG